MVVLLVVGAAVALGAVAVVAGATVALIAGLARDSVAAPTSTEMQLPNGGVRRIVVGSATLTLGGRTTELSEPVNCFAEAGKLDVGSAVRQSTYAVFALRGDPLSPESVNIRDGDRSYFARANLHLVRAGDRYTLSGDVFDNATVNSSRASTPFVISARCPGL